MEITTMQERDIKKTSTKQRIVKIIVTTVTYIFLGLVAISVLFPFYWMLNSSLKSIGEYKQQPPTFFPKQILWGNYVEAFTTANLGVLFLNTVFVGVVSTILSLIVTVLSAFAFARLEFKGKNALFAALLGTMMIPGELFTITNYQTVFNLGWMNTFTVLIVPFLVSIFYIYLLRQNFMQIPNELYYAAKVDGKTDFGYLFKVMIPIARPSIISITILSMIGSWNAYIWPRTVSQEYSMKLVTDGIMTLFQSDTGGETSHIIMAAATIVALPLLIAFVCFKKYIMRGVGRAGLKG